MEIQLKDISLTLGGKEIFKSLDYVFKPGVFYVIKGESGCGKTTLVKCLSSLLEVDEGEVYYSTELPIIELRRKIQYLPQLPVMFEGSVKENLLKPFSFKPYLEDAPDDELLKEKMAELFSEEIKLDKDSKKLSQGEKQRMALCRALLINPDILLCDEPTASLDSKSRKVVEQKIEQFARDSSKTVIFISHHEELLVDQKITTLVLADGKLEELT
ncbi:MAG: ATP-binding cassette domain-containing protein [Lentisphaeraceae bacterium]|nr:ATP-binding cassette domain-containing protein [Lentisphaeraceae bacterium]